MDMLALKIGESRGGGGGDITVEALTATENGTYNPGSGKAFKPVTVAVPVPASQAELDAIAGKVGGIATPSTPASIEAQADDLIADANEATGESDETLTDAVASLIAGQGGTEPEYVTDGLVCHFDAIRNTRAGHDASAEGWEDLSGNGHDLASKGTNPPIWGDNWCYLSNAWLDGAPISGDTPHVEIVMQVGKRGLSVISGNGDTDDTKIGSAIVTSSSILGAKNGSFSHHASLPQQAVCFSSCYESTFSYAFFKGAHEISNGFDFSPTGRMYIASRRTNEQYSFHGYVLAIRFYNRELTNAEIAQNFKADALRFDAGTRVISLDELFTALPTVTTAHTIVVNADQLAAASAETIAIATGKGWTIA